MSVPREEVERIARLVRLRLDDEEVDRLAAEMSRILEHAERLRDVEPGAGFEEVRRVPPQEMDPTHGVRGPEDPESSSDGGAGSGTRAAEADRPDPLHASLEDFAPDMRDGLFAVPPPPGVVAGGEEAPEDGREA